jgi:DNA-binding MarR family transcriptional regulator
MQTSMKPKSPAESLHGRRLPPVLRKAWYGLNQAFRRRIAHTGVTPDQFTALRTLIESDPIGVTQREITVLMSSDPNTVASLLERMEDSGWIERKPHETDRRAYRIKIQPSGKEQFETCRGIALELQTEILKVLGPNNQESFLEQLDLVAQACRQAADNSPRGHR